MNFNEKSKKYNNNKILGNFGEKIGIKLLQKNGYEIIQKNFRTQIGEIDIIAKDKDVLVFIEVKTRKNKNFPAIDAITKKKQLTMSNVANIFISENYSVFGNNEIRFDVILIDDLKIKLLKNAFII